MKRTDTHRPTALIASEYSYVAPDYIKIDGLGESKLLLEYRAQISAHMARTGGTYSTHHHGGNCMVCGNAQALYTHIFYHEATNSYVRMGGECATQVDMGGLWRQHDDRLRKAVKDARDYRAGTQKAAALLADAGLNSVLQVVDDTAKASATYREAYRAWMLENNVEANAWGELATEGGKGHSLYDLVNKDGSYEGLTAEPTCPTDRYEERTISDIYRTVVKYGNLSEKQANFLRSLVAKIGSREALEAKRAAERAAAQPAPEGRLVIEGEVVAVKRQDNDFGSRWVMTVKNSAGWLAWGTIPASINPKTGDRVRFTATLERSQKDVSFAFFKRPAAASVVEA